MRLVDLVCLARLVYLGRRTGLEVLARQCRGIFQACRLKITGLPLHLPHLEPHIIRETSIQNDLRRLEPPGHILDERLTVGADDFLFDHLGFGPRA